MKLKKLLAVAVATLSATSMLSACGKKVSENEIRIGGLAPLSGDLSVYGIATNNGIKLALDEIGTVLDKKIVYKVYDEKGDTAEAVSAYTKLVASDKIHALIGDVTSTPSIAVAQKAVKDKMPMITATGTAEAITQAGPNVFRACFIDPFQGELMASYASVKLEAKTAAILYDTADDYSTGLVAAFEKEAEKLGLEIVSKEGYTGGIVDFKSQLTNISSKNADVLFLPVYYEDVALITVQARDLGIKSALIGADGWDGVLNKVDKSNLDALKNVYFCSHYSAESTDEKLQNFIKNYKEKYGEEPNAFAALGYDAGYLMIEAIKNAGSTDKQAIVDALAAIEFKGVTGDIKFDENRNPIKTASITTITDGAYKFVENYAK